MTQLDLNKMLGGSLPTVTGDSPDIQDKAPEQLSETALDLDSYSVQRGKQWAQDPLIQPFVEEMPDAAPADFLAAAWEPRPELAERPADERRARFLATLMATPDYQNLHSKTMLNSFTAEMAAKSFAVQYKMALEQPEHENELDRDAKNMQDAKEACAAAADDVDVADCMADAFGLKAGDEDGNGGSVDLAAMEATYNRIKNNDLLHSIMQRVGRYMRLAQSMQRSKTVHGCDDVTGIKYSDEISNLLSSELALLGDDDLELEFYRKFTTKNLLCRKMEDPADEAMGPMVVCVDESSSMNSCNKIADAKAMALAMAWIARKQKRWCCLVGWSGRQHSLVIEPGNESNEDLMNWLSTMLGGGTRLGGMCEYVTSNWEPWGCPKGKTDMVIITDDEVNISDDSVEEFNTWRQAENCKTRTIVLGDGGGKVEAISDLWWLASDLDVNANGVAECLGA